MSKLHKNESQDFFVHYFSVRRKQDNSSNRTHFAVMDSCPRGKDARTVLIARLKASGEFDLRTLLCVTTALPGGIHLHIPLMLLGDFGIEVPDLRHI